MLLVLCQTYFSLEGIVIVFLRGDVHIYPFCHTKHQSDVLGACVGINIFIIMFSVTKWFQ